MTDDPQVLIQRTISAGCPKCDGEVRFYHKDEYIMEGGYEGSMHWHMDAGPAKNNCFVCENCGHTEDWIDYGEFYIDWDDGSKI